MGKFTIKMLIFLLIIFVTVGCSEDSTPTNIGKSFDVKLVENTVADAEGSYFLITVDGAQEIDDVVVDRIEGESEETYNSRYEKALNDAKSRGLYIKVFSSQLNAETVVLNKSNGTLTDVNNGVLILVKKEDIALEDETESMNTSYQIQILLDARKADASGAVNIQVGNQKILFNDFQLKKPRIFTDLNGNEIKVIDIPDNDFSDKDNPKIGTNIILDVVNVNVYGYDNQKKEAVGPFQVDYRIQLNKETIAPFLLDDYTQGGEFSGCLSDGSQKCGLNISGYHSLSKDFILSFENKINDTDVITTNASLVARGTMPKEYSIMPYRANYLDNTNVSNQSSVAIFDVDANMGSISLQDISVAGKCDSGQFSLVNNPADNTINKCNYIVKEIEANKNFRIFINAVDAAYAAANGNLNIKIKNDDNIFTSNDVRVDKISYGEKNGGVLDIYKLSVNQATKIKVRLNSFGQSPKVFSYNNSGSKDDKWTTETQFMPVLSSVTKNGSINYTLDNSDCKINSNAVDCDVTVTATDNINKSNAENNTLTFAYTAGTASLVSLPNTVIKFYTAE